MKVAVVTFPGSNCDEDAVHVSRNILRLETTSVWHQDTSLPQGTDLVILPGGFSYGDALRSGALARFSPVMEAVRAHADRGGFVLGICNGFQILLEAGLLPGAMLKNATRKFVCRMVSVSIETTATPFTSLFEKKQILSIPVAHHEGCYYAEADLLDQLTSEDRITLKYEGDNPNGSVRNIAGILNASRNVMGMMPHPERAAESVLKSRDGVGIFQSLVHAVGVG